jgi:hypothetical protein
VTTTRSPKRNAADARQVLDARLESEHVAGDERARHVGPAVALLVARPQVDLDRRVGGQRAAAAAIAASAARRARTIPAISASVLTRRRPAKSPASTVSSRPSARRRSATASGKSGGTAAARSPARSAKAGDDGQIRVHPWDAVDQQRAPAELVADDELGVVAEHAGEAVALEHVREDDRLPAQLQPRERVADASGTSWRNVVERSVAPWIRRSVTRRRSRASPRGRGRAR